MLNGYFIIIPIYYDWNQTADYVRQTAVLLSKENSVVVYQEHRGTSLKEMLLKGKKPEHILEYNRGVYRYSPFSLISFVRFGPIRRLNRALNQLLLLLLLIKKAYGRKILLWCFHPQGVTFRESFPLPHLALYDGVDYYSSVRADDEERIRRDERTMLEMVDVVVVNSNTLFHLYRKLRSDVRVVPLGFSAPVASIGIGVRRKAPVIGYVGAINYRLDFGLLISLVRSRPNWDFVFWGPRQQDSQDLSIGTDEKVAELFSFPNVRSGASTSREDVYKEIEKFDIGIIPYDVSQPMNRRCYPMKLLEYFVAGKPVVATPIEELRRFRGLVITAETARGFSERCAEILRRGWSEASRRRARDIAYENTWARKIEAISTLVIQYETEKNKR